MPASERSPKAQAVLCAAALAMVLLPWGQAALAGEPPKAPAAKAPGEKPITTARGPLGDLLRKWYAEGTAAGNQGDWYDNRDRGHSNLDLGPYPQLQKVTYTEPQRKIGADWAAMGGVRPQVTFGNSSTSAGVHQGGSNARMLYTHPRGLALLCAQYARNNLYIYPEHNDYDPGHNGSGGFGDLYPTNTPYLIISQGSSGSDQPFMRALPYALAAFRPEVKRKLVESGLLMPTLQMIFRTTNKHLADPKDYLTGKAHPPVFDGAWVNDLKMAELAHEIRPENLPPMIQLEAVEEDAAEGGKDFFDLRPSEKHADTPAVIARICRGRGHAHRIVVSAEKSYDLNKHPLAFHWAVLCGDAARVRIQPLNPASAAAEIVVPYHERRPIAPGSPMESNRVDIGVFAHNGTYYSAPGFITFLFLDDEARTYDDAGRALEIGYGMGETEVSVPNWVALLDLFKPDAGSLGSQLLKKPFKKDEVAAILQAGQEYKTAHAALTAAQEAVKRAETVRQRAGDQAKNADGRRGEAQAQFSGSPSPEADAALSEAEYQCWLAQAAIARTEADLVAARQAADTARKADEEVLNKKRDGLARPVREAVLGAVRDLVKDPALYTRNAKAIGDLLQDDGRKAAFAAARKRLQAWGLLRDSPGGDFVLQAVRSAATPESDKLTRFEKALLEQFNGDLANRLLFPGTVNCSWKRNFVDPSISAPKSWRDLYRYDPQGNCLGWTRYDGEKTTEFNADGLIVLEKDPRGRCVKARTVAYAQENPNKDGRPHFGPNWNPLKAVPAKEVVFYEYAGDADLKGRAAKKELAKEGT